MTGLEKLTMGCFVIGLFSIGLALSAFSADSGTGGALHPKEYLIRLLVGIGFWVLGFLSLVVQRVRGKRGKGKK